MSIPRQHLDGRLDQLLADHYAAVVDLAERLTSDGHAAEDVAQEAFTQAGQALRQGGGPDPWDGWRWLETATVRLAHARSAERTEVVAASDLGDAFADLAGARVDHALVRRALERLDPVAAEALHLHHVEAQRHGEIARRLRVPHAKVVRLLRDGAEQLRLEYLALARAAGRLTLVQWTVQRARRFREACQRLSDERLVVALRGDFLPALGVWATTATNVTLAAIVAVTVAGQPGGGQPTTVAASAGAPSTVSGPTAGREPSAAGPGGTAETPEGNRPVAAPATVKISPAVVTRAKPDETEHVVTPVEGQVGQKYSYELVPGTPGFVSVPVGFECPPPDRRPPGPALGCPVLEAVS